MSVIDIITDLSALTKSQRDVVTLLKQGVSRSNVARQLGLNMGTVQNHLYLAVKRTREGKPSGRCREHFVDPLDNETPREARARVARDLKLGLRCRHPMLSGAPCSLLLPCASHDR
jgi:FixJ family two-component response regulator